MNQSKQKSPAEMYQEYLVPGMHAPWTPIFLEHAQPEPGDAVLDVACGTGIVARTVAEDVGVNGHVVGVDVNPEMLRVASDLPEPNGASVEWQECDATVTLPDGPFDLVLCQQALQFFDDQSAAVAGMQAALKDTGTAAISVWKDLSHHPVYETLNEEVAQYLGVPVEDIALPFRLGSLSELQDLLRTAGFSDVQIVEESHPVRFPSPERFVALTVLAAASIIPKTDMDADARNAMVGTIQNEVDDTLSSFIDGNTVTFPMHAMIAIAQP